MTTTDKEILRKNRLHLLARDVVNEVVAGRLTDKTGAEIAELALPPLKQQWVREQVEGIRGSRGVGGTDLLLVCGRRRVRVELGFERGTTS
jgi:hypothetical protein